MFTHFIAFFQARNHSNAICVRGSSAGFIAFFIRHSLPLLKDLVSKWGFSAELKFEFSQKMIPVDLLLKLILPGLTISPST